MRRVLLAGLILVLAYFAVTTTLVAVWMGKDERPRADAIVVLGAAQYDGRPSAIYRARLEHALQLYKSDVAPLLVFTGGNEPGDRFTEGGTGARWARERGVPPSAILTEERSRTTLQNLAGAKQELTKRLGKQRHRVVVVSDPFHMFRAVQAAESVGLEAHPSPTRTSPLTASKTKLIGAVLREDLALAAHLLSSRR